MNSMDASWITKLRQKYNLLLFLTTASIPLVLWLLLMMLSLLTGTFFKDPNTLGMDLFTVFVFPLIAAPIISGLALLVAKLLTVPVVRWLVIFGLGVIAPIVGFLLALVGHWIARALYLGDKASLPRIPFGRSPAANAPKVIVVGAAADTKMEQLKDMLDKGLISFKDYERKKADILAEM